MSEEVYCARTLELGKRGLVMADVNLRPFLRPKLDVLFVALNPPEQSNANGHYFSESSSRFFHLLARSGLTTKEVPWSTADEVVFGSTAVNYMESEFGVVDLVGDLVQTSSARVIANPQHVRLFLQHIRELEPRFVCVIRGCNSQFVLNYFPDGNAIPDEPKLEIFRALREAL